MYRFKFYSGPTSVYDVVHEDNTMANVRHPIEGEYPFKYCDVPAGKTCEHGWSTYWFDGSTLVLVLDKWPWPNMGTLLAWWWV